MTEFRKKLNWRNSQIDSEVFHGSRAPGAHAVAGVPTFRMDDDDQDVLGFNRGNVEGLAQRLRAANRVAEERRQEAEQRAEHQIRETEAHAQHDYAAAIGHAPPQPAGAIPVGTVPVEGIGGTQEDKVIWSALWLRFCNSSNTRVLRCLP